MSGSIHLANVVNSEILSAQIYSQSINLSKVH